MILSPIRSFRIATERLFLRPPASADYRNWSQLRAESEAFLAPWEPQWAADHLSRAGFARRVRWARRSILDETAIPLFVFRRAEEMLVGAITLDNIRRGPAQTASLGYWIGQRHARRGYMREAIEGIVGYAFEELDLSRIEAACLPENAPSRGLLEKCGFKYEGVAQSYLQIGGRWRTHVLYSSLRHDRRGRTEAGLD